MSFGPFSARSNIPVTCVNLDGVILHGNGNGGILPENYGDATRMVASITFFVVMLGMGIAVEVYYRIGSMLL